MASRRQFRIDKQIAADSDSYEQDIILKYLEYLRETDNAIEVGNVVFDVEQIVRRKFVCDTRLCLDRRNGHFAKRRSCCTDYAVRVSSEEMARIRDFMPQIESAYPDVGEAAKAAGGFYEYDDWYDRVLRKKPEGTCIFLSDQGHNNFHCAIHGACLKHKKNPFRMKPSACALFPLCYLEHEDGFILTAYSMQNVRVIEDENEPIPFDCCAPNPLATRPMYVEMKDTIIQLLGEDCYQGLVREVKRRGLDRG